MTIEPIPAPPLPAEGLPLVACSLGYSLPNGESGLGYPYGYGSDVCIEVDPCLVDGWLFTEYSVDVEVGDPNMGSLLYTATTCTISDAWHDRVFGETEVGSAPTATPVQMSELPATGASIEGVTVLIAIALMSLGGWLRRLSKR